MSEEPDESLDKPANAQLVCIAVGRWPFMFMVATDDIEPGDIFYARIWVFVWEMRQVGKHDKMQCLLLAMPRLAYIGQQLVYLVLLQIDLARQVLDGHLKICNFAIHQVELMLLSRLACSIADGELFLNYGESFWDFQKEGMERIQEDVELEQKFEVLKHAHKRPDGTTCLPPHGNKLCGGLIDAYSRL